MIWLTNFGMLLMVALVILYWRSPPAWRPALLAAGGAAMLIHDGWASVAAWSALLCWLALVCASRWARPIWIQRLGLAALFVAFAAYQYAKASHALAPLLGFAFVTLKAWHLIVEDRHGQGQGQQHRLATTLAYLLFPPTLPLGPVQRYDAFRLELMRARWDRQLASQGLERILYGYCKVILLANFLLAGKLAGLAGASGTLWLDTYLGLVAYGLNLYLQFSGYCDIAIGCAALFGIRVPENFRYPFAARSLPDFWRRWHITVSEWCRDFVFRPVFSQLHQYVYASLASMIVLGLWHELSPRYLAWGLFHGAGLGAAHLWSNHVPLAATLRQYKAWTVACWFLTLQFVIASFAFTSTSSMRGAFIQLGILSGLTP